MVNVDMDKFAAAIEPESKTAEQTLQESGPSILPIKIPGETIAARLKERLAPSFDSIPTPIPVTRRGNDMPLQHEWLDMPGVKLAGRLLARYSYGEHLEHVEEIVAIGRELNGDTGDVDPAFVSLWAKALWLWYNKKARGE